MKYLKMKNLVIICFLFIFLIGCNKSDKIKDDNPFLRSKVDVMNSRDVNNNLNNNNTEEIEKTAEFIKYYNNAEQLLEVCDTVFKGTVLAANYFVVDGQIYTIETVKVESSMLGDLVENQEIYVIQSRGVVTLDSYISSFRDEDNKAVIGEWYSDFSKEELKQNYISRLGTGVDSQGTVGQTNIIFSESTSEFKTYIAEVLGIDAALIFDPFSGYMGEFREQDNGLYRQLTPGMTVEMVNEMLQEKESKKNYMNSDLETVETQMLNYETIKAEVLKKK